MTWNSDEDRCYRIEKSPDLRTWRTLADEYPAGGATGISTSFTDTSAGIPGGFYRVVLLPPFIEFVTVGNPGNAADSRDGDGNTFGTQRYGTVNHIYRIGKFEVTNRQYATFLNAVAAAADAHGLYNPAMGNDSVFGGIGRSGTPGDYHYTAKAGFESKPVVYVSFWDACRFCNWLHNGRPQGTQHATTTEDGAYDLSRFEAISGNLATRKPGARFFLPSEDEWYKAAYHDPRAPLAGGPPGDRGYWSYPTRSEIAPAAQPPPGVSNSANYLYAIQGGALTNAGAYAGTKSFYGAFDMAGNAWEWNEGISGARGEYRALRGSAWFLTITLDSSSRWGGDPAYESFPGQGFRVGSL